MEVKYLI